MPPAKTFAVATLGARMHYAVPRILHAAGRLERFFTDLCAGKGWPRGLAGVPPGLRPSGLKRLLARVPQGLPPERITAFSMFGLEYAWRLSRARSSAEQTAVFLWGGRTFCRKVVAAGLGNAAGVYALNSAALELFQFARRAGLVTVLEQSSAPRGIENEIMAPEYERFPGWATPPGDTGREEEYFNREKEEWSQASVILCPSDFVRAAVAQAGGPRDRCVVVPYGFDAACPPVRRTGRSGPLRVLTVGHVALQKGSHYVLAAARLMGDRAQFRMVGRIAVGSEAEAELRTGVELVGAVSRSEVQGHYAWADVFLLPSLCEGSALVCYEALAAGLPVLCTPNAGSVIRDGVDGFIVRVRDPEAIAGRLEELARDPERRAAMSDNARARSAGFALDAYRDRMIGAVDRKERSG